MSDVFLVRHGQGRLDGGPYDQLSELGRIQAEMLGRRWTAIPFKVDRVYCGTLKRQMETAQIVADTYGRSGLDFPKIRVDERFDEIDAFDIVKRTAKRLSEQDPRFRDLAERTRLAMMRDTPDKLELFDRTYRKIIDTWINSTDRDLTGMTWDEFCRGVLDTRAELEGYGESARIVVITSGNPIGIYIKEALDLSLSMALEIVNCLYNTNVTHLVLKKDRMMLISMNVTSHLEAHQKTHI